MPRSSCRPSTGQHSGTPAAPQSTPAPGSHACVNTGGSASLSATSALPTRAKHRGRGRPRTSPGRRSCADPLRPHLAPDKPGSASHEVSPTSAASSPPGSHPAFNAISIADSETAARHREAAPGTKTLGGEVAVPAQLPSPLSLSPLRVPISSSPMTAAPSLATSAPVGAVQGGRETVTFASHVPSHASMWMAASTSESKAAGVASRAKFSAEPLLPSMAACMAACFGWRLKRCSVVDEDKIMLVLQHQAVPVVRVTIESTGSAFAQACSASSGMEPGAVLVNGTLMSFSQCAAYLHELTHALFKLSGISQSGPLTDHVPAKEESAAAPDLEPVLSPSAREPSQLSPTAQVKATQRRAAKRVRSRSPSRHPHLTASVPRAAAFLPGATVRSLTEAPAAAAGDDGKASKGESQPDASPMTCISALTLAPLAAPPPAFTAAADVQVKAVKPLFGAPPKRGKQASGEDTKSLGAVAALVAEMEGSELSPALPRAPPASRTSPGKFSTASKGAASSVDKGPGSKQPPTSSTVFASPIMRQRRALVPTTATAASAAGSVSPSAGVHHASSASPSPPHVALRIGTFTMPYAFRHASTAPFAADAAPENFDVTSASKALPCSLWCDSAGWSTDSSRLWLAHTHAVSRTFECMPVPCFSELVPTMTTEKHGDEGAERQKSSALASAPTSSSLMDTAAAGALVRMTLWWRWRERSSIWTMMEDSLRIAVGSGHLRGDALEAGVQALQAGEEEQRQYNGIDAGADENGGVRGLLCERTASSMGHASHGEERKQTPSFPTCPPHALLPVSGKAVIEAQHRIADTEEDRAQEESAHGPRYVACAGGISYADRIVIDHTYSTRGSYVVAPPSMTERTAAAPRRFLTLKRNPQEDLHYHVYKRFMPTDMRVAMAAETQTVRPCSVALVQEHSAGPSAAYHLDRDHSGGEGGDEDEEERDDGGDEAGERKAVSSPTAVQVTPRSPAATKVTGAGGGGPYTDMDYVLRYRPAIRRIPMPDVESRYGP
ncbi:hypothetical protein LSCM1_00425 [Leishmania martiniquensis]|uniref:Uncharacterized protein n=1 Tax=Leishmania martiniquensis TaxID=1580590 RepID=A0A836G2S2_9TRYP|nr:hypothetical protein LSCM1_00425 [Leishmania martiniquensis]